MAYATTDDVEAALGRSLDGLNVDFLLDTSSDLIDGYLNGLTPTDPVPGTVIRVCAEMVANVINRPQSPTDPADDAYTVGPFAYHVGPNSVGPWLSASQKERLDLFGVGGLSQFDTHSEIVGSDVSWSVSGSFDPYSGTDLSSQGGS